MDLGEEFIQEFGKVNWSDVKSVIGECSFFEERLEKYSFKDEKFWSLEGYVYQNRELSEGSLFILPFLFRLLEITDLSNVILRESIYDNLFEILNSYKKINYSVRYVVVKKPFEYFLPSTINPNQEELPLFIACRTYISSILDFFIKQLEYENIEILESILDIIVSFCEYEYLVITSLIDCNNNFRSVKRKEVIKKYLIDYTEETNYYDVQYILNQLE